MIRTVWALVAVSALVACKPAAPSAPAAAPDPAAVAAVEQLDGFRTEVCACTSTKCANEVAARRATWLAGEHGKYAFTEAQRADADKANAAFTECSTTRGPTAADAIADMRAARDRMCACKDKACSEQAMADLMKMADKYEDLEPDEASAKEATAVAEELMKCMQRFAQP